MTTTAILAGAAGLFGACVGSFLNVCIYRIPREDLTVGKPRRSFCPGCGAPIHWTHNVPIISWVALRGRCHHCRNPISIRYPFVEAMTAFFFVITVVSLGSESLTSLDLVTLAAWWVFFSVLIVVTFIDIDHRIIPDSLSVNGALVVPWLAWFLPGVPRDPFPFATYLPSSFATIPPGVAPVVTLTGVGLICGVSGMVLFRRFSPAWDGSRRTLWDTRLAGSVAALVGIAGVGVFLLEDWTSREESHALLSSLLGMTVGAGTIYTIGVLGKLAFRKDAMGFGDVKLMAFLGAVLGAKSVLFAVFIACLIGTIVGIGIKIVTRSSYMPFGPFLSAGAVVMVLWADVVQAALDWYMQFSQGLVHQVISQG